MARRRNQITADALPLTDALKCEFIADVPRGGGSGGLRSRRVEGNVTLLTALSSGAGLGIGADMRRPG